MMKTSISAIICILFALPNYAQDKYDPAIIAGNNIKKIEGYIFKDETATDSFLITKEYFNSKGRRTKIEVYDSIGISAEYIYKYQNDTLRIARVTRIGGKYHSTTMLSYDRKFRETKAVDYDRNGRKSGNRSKTKYNDRKRTSETKLFISKKLAVHTKKQFDSTGKLIQYKIKENGKWVDKYENGLNPNTLMQEFENYNGKGVKLEQKKQFYDKNTMVLGLNGTLKVAARDTLVTERYVFANGLLAYEIQYLNEKLIAIKKYKYELN